MVGERMDDDGGVLARLHHLVQIEDGALAHGPRQGPVHPDRFSALEQESAHQIRRRHVLVARDGDQVAAELVGHRLHEAGLPASRGALQQHRQTAARRGAKHLHLVTDRPVERRVRGNRVHNGGLTVSTCHFPSFEGNDLRKLYVPPGRTSCRRD